MSELIKITDHHGNAIDISTSSVRTGKRDGALIWSTPTIAGSITTAAARRTDICRWSRAKCARRRRRSCGWPTIQVRAEL